MFVVLLVDHWKVADGTGQDPVLKEQQGHKYFKIPANNKQGSVTKGAFFWGYSSFLIPV